MMEMLFGSRKTPAEMLKQHQRSLTKASRELDRERAKLESQEKKLIIEIKKSAKNGQNNAAKIQAKDLVRTRRYIHNFYQMRTQLQAVSLKIQTLKSTAQMTEALKGVTKAMSSMNKKIQLPGIQKIMMDFTRESEMMDMKQEMLEDAVEDVMEGDGEEEETDEVLQKVLDEIGVDLGEKVLKVLFNFSLLLPLQLKLEMHGKIKIKLLLLKEPLMMNYKLGWIC